MVMELVCAAAAAAAVDAAADAAAVGAAAAQGRLLLLLLMLCWIAAKLPVCADSVPAQLQGGCQGVSVSPAAAMLVQRADIPVSLLAPADAELILCPSMLMITSMRCFSQDWVVFCWAAAPEVGRRVAVAARAQLQRSLNDINY